MPRRPAKATLSLHYARDAERTQALNFERETVINEPKFLVACGTDHLAPKFWRDSVGQTVDVSTKRGRIRSPLCVLVWNGMNQDHRLSHQQRAQKALDLQMSI